ncbi:DUF1080 domain-containing protein [Fontisphaera persica]|uniref:3-keto-disaccharide hydrolase n=1 Tax=Fontisphaera persica TaxID=2974023 RepID=UPI0024C0D444|nr:DUF1080 domain-containing protein [Fontisphaera persica]WCJ61103.1 DUF1080 domain-containing protein [Fontisphaera persica]
MKTTTWKAHLGILGLCLGLAVWNAQAAAGQWVNLFNGKDLTGWIAVHDIKPEVVEGNLQIHKGMGWLRLEKQYKDFILEFEWRAYDEDYDSGIYMRAPLDGKPWPDAGFQVNLRYNALGALVKNRKTIVPAETPKLPINKWHKMRIEVRGNKAKLFINDEANWETDLVDRPEGYIGIQVEDKKFDFRNIRIMEL